jgi:hypothetical protein
MPQAAGYAVISCICAAHTKYESNPLDWQRVVEIGYCLFTRRDMVKFQEMCKDGLLGPGDYGIFEDWSDIDRSQDGYIHIRDWLLLEGEIQEMNDEENFYNEGPYQARVRGFSWRTTRWLLIVGGSCSVQQNRSVIPSSR